MLKFNDFSEQDIASVAEWLTKNRLQKVGDAFEPKDHHLIGDDLLFELNYAIPFCNFNMKKGQIVLIAYWF